MVKGILGNIAVGPVHSLWLVFNKALVNDDQGFAVHDFI